MNLDASTKALKHKKYIDIQKTKKQKKKNKINKQTKKNLKKKKKNTTQNKTKIYFLLNFTQISI
jgi:hypothetical protein